MNNAAGADLQRGGSQMKRAAIVLSLACSLASVAHAQQASNSLSSRIAHTDPASYRHLEAVHDGAGSMDFAALLGTEALSTNFIFLYRGVNATHSGIGQHFHN